MWHLSRTTGRQKTLKLLKNSSSVSVFLPSVSKKHSPKWKEFIGSDISWVSFSSKHLGAVYFIFLFCTTSADTKTSPLPTANTFYRSTPAGTKGELKTSSKKSGITTFCLHIKHKTKTLGMGCLELRCSVLNGQEWRPKYFLFPFLTRQME